MNSSILVFALVALAEVPNSQAAAAPRRPLFEINRQISSLFQRDALATSDQQRAQAAYEMTELYRQILDDPRFVSSPALQEYRARLWSRLTRIRKDVQADLRRAGKSDLDGNQLQNDNRELAAAVTQSLGDQFSIMAASLGGPSGVFAQAGAAGGRAGPPDYGPDLVDLIQRTIQPEFWDVHGGPGTIVYYRPLHCLVVRATSEVHHQVGGTVSALRGAGR
jgi:hypothetical protein